MSDDGRSATPHAVRSVHHVSFRVDDLASSLEFYEGLLGCEPRHRPDMGFPGAWLRKGDIEVHLLEVPRSDATGAPPPKATSKANHVAFEVEDLDGFRRFLEDRGYEIVVSPRSNRQVWVQDPSGNVVEFISPAE
jgi:glyoxylase I family protein